MRAAPPAGVDPSGGVGVGIDAVEIAAPLAGSDALSQERRRESSSGVSPAKRTWAGALRTTRPQEAKASSFAFQLRRTVWPASKGMDASPWTPAVVTVAAGIPAGVEREATCTDAGKPSLSPYASPSEAERRPTNCSLGMGMKKASLAPARKHSSRSPTCAFCSTATTCAPLSRSGLRACSAAGRFHSGVP